MSRLEHSSETFGVEAYVTSTRINCLIVLILLTVMGIGPMPVTSVVGIYVVLFRPRWFKLLVDRIYEK